MAIILVRYCEIGLKSAPVRRKFETYLRDNMLTMLANDHVEALITYGDARYYLETDDVERCTMSLRKVFGVASISITCQCSSDMGDICRTAAEFSRGRISPGQSFAVRARREGTHAYTSMDLGKEAGSAIFLANKDIGITVALRSPDKMFYVEVRNNKAYIFDEYIRCPGGLPMGSQGRVIADIRNDRGIVSAWFMMRRGCRVFTAGDGDSELLRMYDPSIRAITGVESQGFMRDILAKVSGASIDDISGREYAESEVPLFYPTIGMTDGEVSEMLERIRTATF